MTQSPHQRTTEDFVRHLMRVPSELAFDPNATRPEIVAWRRLVRRKLRQLLAFPDVPEQPAPQLLGQEPREGYVLEKWEIYPEPGCAVPLLMLVPEGLSARNRAPAVLCFPGSECPKEVLCGEPWDGPWENKYGETAFMARQFVRQGFVAAAMDNPATGELASPSAPDWERQWANLIWLGRSYEGVSVFQKLTALRWIRSLPFVDGRCVAACGHSLGAKPALLMGVLDGCLAAVVWNDQASSWRERALALSLSRVAPWHYVPGFLRWFDYVDLMCALAPTPLLITEGGVVKDHQRIRKAYALQEARGSVKISFMPNFRDPAKRSRKRPPEDITPDTYYAGYANCDGAHYFKNDVAVPWLCATLGVEHRDRKRGGP